MKTEEKDLINSIKKESVEKKLSEPKKISEDLIEKAGGKDKLRRLFLPKNEEDTETIEVIACVPKRKVMGQYLKFQNSDPAKAQEILVKNCILTDLQEVLDDDGLFYTAFSEIVSLIPIREAEVKKY
jgi:hypothetical protein